jgi:hypothetical protein
LFSSTSNATETTCVGPSETILSHFASSDALISHTWRVFRVDSDGEEASEDDGVVGGSGDSVVENVSDRLGKAGLSCYYTA